MEMHRIMSDTDKLDQKSRLLHAVNGAAAVLLTTDEEAFEDSLREGMRLMAECMDVDRVYIWQNVIEDGLLHYIQIFEWMNSTGQQAATVRSHTGFSYTGSFPEWEAIFSKRECVNGPISRLSQSEQERMDPYGIQSILVIPIYLQDRFWGFVSFDDCHQKRTFTKDEVDILRSGSLMLASAMVRHETAAKMREADDRAKLMLDSTPLSCCLWNKNFRIYDCNEAALKFFGLNSKQEFFDSFPFISPEFQPDGRPSMIMAEELVSTAFRDGKIVVDWMHQKIDGTPLPTEVTLVRIKHEDEDIVAGYMRDLREYTEMMKAIEYKDTLLHTVNEVATILLQSEIDEFENDLHRCMGIMSDSVDADRMYIWKNYENDGQTCCTQLYEWSENAEPQQGSEYTVDIPLPSFWVDKLSNGQYVNSIVSGRPSVEQAHLFAQNILSILIVPVFLDDQFWGFVGFDDCHRERIFSENEESFLRSGSLLIAHALLRNEMTQSVHAAVDQAQAASRAKSAFVARMSHEIRTPMNVISGMTELILREDVPHAIYEHVLSIKQEGTNMLSLVNDILDFSKIEAGTLNIASAEYSLTSLINNILIIIRMKVSERPVLFTTNIDCHLPNRLIGDEARIRQVLLNVLDNAAKYTFKGFISLTVNGEITDDTVVLTAEVSDSGIGIKSEDMDSLFDDFVRIDGNKNKSVQGTGLGLAITKSLCEAMGGDISVHSEYGVGSTFTINIPQKIKSQDEKFASVSDPASKPVLLYETRSIYADSIASSFECLGVFCTQVISPQEFYEELKHRSYPFVFVSSLLSESARQIVEELKLDTKMILLTEYGEAPAMRNVRTIAMPVHAATIANILDDIDDNIFYNENGHKSTHFIAPSAEILVVDDLSTNLKVAQGLMLPYQVKVDICKSGEEALEYVQNKRYDIIFMDHMMPGMDGIDTTIHIRSLEDGSGYYGSVPIIALTANAVTGVKEMFLQNGMNDFLAKPIDVAKLHGLLKKWIPEEKKQKNNIAKATDIDPVQMQIEGVDVHAGITLTGGTIDGYLKTLSIFYVDGMEKIKKIRDSVEKNDIDMYTVYVHALKSAAANIGASEISNLFKALEKVGAKGNVSLIHESTERILGELETLLSKIHVVVSKHQREPIEDFDPEFLRNELLELKEALNNRDAGEIDDIMSRLGEINCDQKTIDMLKEISRHILLINYADAADLVDTLLMR